MMKIERAMRSTKKPRTVHDVGNLPVGNQRKHSRPVVRIIFKVSILDDNYISPGMREPGPQSGTLASISLVKKRGERETALVLWTICRKVKLAAVIKRNAAPDAVRIYKIPQQP